jgi:hypothetical protein
MIKKTIFFLSLLLLFASIYYGYEKHYTTETILAIITALIGIFTCNSSVRSKSQSIVIEGDGNNSRQSMHTAKKIEVDQIVRVLGQNNESTQEMSQQEQSRET